MRLDRLRALLPPRRPLVWWLWHLVLVLAMLAVSVGFGVTTATARGALGPHEAQFEVTTDGAFTVDVGPLGKLQLDSALPGPLGARAVVQEIPQDVTGVGQADTLMALQEDLDQYVGLFNGISHELRSVQKALVRDATRRAGAMFGGLVVAGLCLRLLLGRARREEIVAPLRSHPRVAVAGGLVVVVGVTAGVGSWVGRDRPRPAGVAASQVFDGTPLEGAQITGRLGGIVDTYSGLVVSSVQENDKFYDGATDSLRTAWGDYEKRRDRAARAPAPTPTPEPTEGEVPEGEVPEGEIPEGAVPEGDELSPGPTLAPSPTPSPSPTPTRPPVTVLFVSDLHCNVGMARVITELVTLSGAQVVVDGGDTSINGTAVEQQCVETFADAVPRGVRLVAVPGNHDSHTTTRAYDRAGATILSGSVVTVNGIRFFGDADPNPTTFGDTASDRQETEKQAGTRIADAACGQRVDVLLVHNPRVARPSLDRGCAPVSLNGHMHSRTDPVQVGQGVRYITATSGGAHGSSVTLGPLKTTAELTVLQWDPTTRLFVSWQIVQINTDGTATVGDPEPWPSIVKKNPQSTAPDPPGGY
ncbi:MAG: metallophosphoesterase [Micrococcales bacterium]|nr:metallophosphoesterase [Micrococcales bacterium]